MKQLFYGIFYLALFAGAGFFIYSQFFAPPAETCFDNIQNQNEGGVDCGGPCGDCELQTIRIIEGNIKVLPLSRSTSAVFLNLENRSLKYGISKFDYTFEIFSKLGGPRIAILKGTSSLYPQESKNLIEIVGYGIDDLSPNVEFSTGQIEWTESKMLPERPELIIRNQLTFSQEDSVFVEGVISNMSKELIAAALVKFVGFDNNNSVLRASVIKVDDFLPGSDRPFRISLPLLEYKSLEVSHDVIPQ